MSGAMDSRNSTWTQGCDGTGSSGCVALDVLLHVMMMRMMPRFDPPSDVHAYLDVSRQTP